MDDPRQNKPSGIPRPSRLPVQASKLPVPQARLVRPSPSREALAAGPGSGNLRNPKLRTTPSRDQLAPTSNTAAASPLRAVSSPQSRSSIGPTAANNARTPRLGPNAATQTSRLLRGGGQPASQTLRSASAATGPLRRRPSQQWISAGDMPPQEEETLGWGDQGPLTDDGLGEESAPTSPSKSRPSLAERTMETLSRLPSSPSVKGKGAASFYDAAAAARKPSSRPGSSHQSDGSGGRSGPGSRPGSSLGLEESGLAAQSHTAAYSTQLPTIEATPLRSRKSIQSFQTPSGKATPARLVRASIHGTQTPTTVPVSRPRTPSPDKHAISSTAPRSAPKSLAVRPPTKRPSMNGLLKKSATAQGKALSADTSRKTTLASRGSSVASYEGTNASSASVASASTAVTADSPEPGQAYKKTSAALREQIAKAKAAKRAVPSQEDSSSNPTPAAGGSLVPTDTGFDFGLSSDPFNQHRDDKSQAKVLRSRLEAARTSGRLNIAAMGLKEIPADVLDMYNLESIGQSGSAWAESVDLTRFVAADNELEMISDSVLPDVDPQEFAEDEDNQGNIFAGLETLDLHGNILVTLPTGLRRLSLLTSLNLSLNRLSNSCLEVISQVSSLKDLKLAGNLLYGPLDPCFSKLENLEILDLHGNNLSSLPPSFGTLSRLRILNLSENSFEELPFGLLAALPLTELTARKNQLRGTLIPDAVDTLPTLQMLDVSSNQLVNFCSPGRKIALPGLHQLCVSVNRLQGLPDISSWSSLLTLAADENNINAIPDGFTQLEQLRSVDFSSNDIRVVPAEIGRMENLANLRLSGNPLREKKFSSISTDEMKSILAQRLEPPAEEAEHTAEPATCSTQEEAHAGGIEPPTASHNHAQDDDDDSRSDLDDFATPPTSAPASPARSRSQTATWPVKPGGVLDRSNTQSSSLHPVLCSKLAATHKIHEIQLHHNLFAALPDSLTFFAETLTALSLAYNQLVGVSYLLPSPASSSSGAAGPAPVETLDLPALRELNLAHNHITSLAPLVARLRAPCLQKLDVSFNRVAALPMPANGEEGGGGRLLRDAFPELAVLLVSNNHLAELDPEAVRGLRVVDAANNDIAHLNPRLGLLGGLERLEVGGNRFRVPRWNVLERGTEATLRWLRGRVPVAEMGGWKGEEGEGEEFE